MWQKTCSDLLGYLPDLGLFSIIIYLYFSKKFSKDKENYYLLTGLIFLFLCNISKYYVNRFMMEDYLHISDNMIQSYFVINVFSSFAFKLILFSIIFYLLKFEIIKNEIKRENIFLMMLYGALSFGLFVPYWLIKKDIKFNAKLSIWIIPLIFFLSCIHTCLITVFNSASHLIQIVTIFYWVGQVGYVTCFLVCIYTLRKQIMEKLKGIEINSVWTFFIGILHIQFSLNQYIRKHEK
jgi:hypothetical protein